MTSAGSPFRSTADAQRERITACAVTVFARTGYFATPVAQVAEAAGVSPAYVFRLFDSKLGLFVAAVTRCYDTIATVLAQAAEACPSGEPADRLAAMTATYIALVADRDQIMIQVHAQSACDVPEIRQAVQSGLSRVVSAVSASSGASDPDVQRFLAYGQLCHLIVQAGIVDVEAGWATTLTAGIGHLN